jgi:hypothetical protein
MRPIRYWTLIFQTRRQITLNHIITVYNDVFDHFDSILGALKTNNSPFIDDCSTLLRLRSHKRDMTRLSHSAAVVAVVDEVHELRDMPAFDYGLAIQEKMHDFPVTNHLYTTAMSKFLVGCGHEYGD